MARRHEMGANHWRRRTSALTVVAIAMAGGCHSSSPSVVAGRSTTTTSMATSVVPTSASSRPATMTRPTTTPTTSTSPTTTTTTTTTSATPPAATYPLHVDGTHRYLLDAAGRPFLLRGDAAWSLIAQLSRDDVVKYLDDRKARGFNAVLVNLLEHKFASHAPADLAGDQPFTTRNDFSTPNERYFAYADWVIDQAAQRGMVVMLAPSYLGYEGADDGWYRAMEGNGPDKLRAYGRYIGQRYARFTNIVWVEGGDYNPPNRSLVEAVATGIADTDPTAIHTAHNAPETAARDYWQGQPWLALNTVYTYEGVYNAAIPQQQKSTMPFILMESTYENEHGATSQGVRAQAYEAMLAGATGEVFGNNPIWHFDGPGIFGSDISWQEALGGPGSRSMTHLGALFSGLDWPALEPDVDESFLQSGGGLVSGVPIDAVARDKSFAVVYLPGSETVTLNLRALAGTAATLTWFDPSDGSSSPASASPVPTAEPITIHPESANAEGSNDWVLVVQAS